MILRCLRLGAAILGPTLGWSDLAIFFYFWNLRDTVVDHVYFRSSIQKICNFGHTCTHCTRGNFIFSKNHRDLKTFYLIFKTFFIHQRTIAKNEFEIKIILKKFFLPKMSKTVFDLYKGKIFVLKFLFSFSF